MDFCFCIIQFTYLFVYVLSTCCVLFVAHRSRCEGQDVFCVHLSSVSRRGKVAKLKEGGGVTLTREVEMKARSLLP